MAWIKVDTSFFRRGEMVRAGAQAQMLWIRARCLSMELLTDGSYCREELETLGLPRLNQRIAALVQERLWVVTWEDEWLDPTYLDDHPSAARVRRISSSRRQAARVRWEQNAMQPAEQNAEQNAMQDAMQNRTEETREEENRENGSSTDSTDHTAGARLPKREDIDMRGRMAHFAAEQERCQREYGPFAVEQQLDRLAHSQAVVDELGRPLTNADLDRIVTNWLQHGQPATAMRLAGTTSTGTPWWRLCLDGRNDFDDKAKRKPEGEPLHSAYERLKARQARKEGAHAQAE